MSLDILPGSEFFTFMTSVNTAFVKLYDGATPEQRAYFVQALIDDRNAVRSFLHLPPTVVSAEALTALKTAESAAQTTGQVAQLIGLTLGPPGAPLTPGPA